MEKLNNEDLEIVTGGVIVEKHDGNGGTDYYLCDEKNYGRFIGV